MNNEKKINIKPLTYYELKILISMLHIFIQKGSIGFMDLDGWIRLRHSMKLSPIDLKEIKDKMENECNDRFPES